VLHLHLLSTADTQSFLLPCQAQRHHRLHGLGPRTQAGTQLVQVDLSLPRLSSYVPHTVHSTPSPETLTCVRELTAIFCQTHVSLESQNGCNRQTSSFLSDHPVSGESLKTQCLQQAGEQRRNSTCSTDFLQCRGQMCKKGAGSSNSAQGSAAGSGCTAKRGREDTGGCKKGSAKKEG